MDANPVSFDDAIRRVDAGAQGARLWIDEVRANAVSVANQADSLIDDCRRARLASRRLGASAARNNCVGVFGPSQAGKSYLVSALARPRDGQLKITVGGTTKDFISEINPPGNRESTGLVSRFTIHRTAPDPAYPVEIRLLTEADLVKILANSFFLDFDANNLKIAPPGEADLREVVTAARAAAQGEPKAHLDEIALYDLGEYFQRNFKARINEFNRAGYWEALIDLGGRLPLAERARFFAPLWGRIDAFTGLYVHLVEALERIGHAPAARAAMKAIEPRLTEDFQPNSIIDVGVLERLRTDTDAGDLIEVVPVSDGTKGAEAQLPRATLTALVAEIRLTIDAQGADVWPFFEHTDLLDFPGARSRLKLVAMPEGEPEQSRQLRELFLRGKIAYLFQRYTDELELTSMLLCMPPSVQEVKDLAGMVQSWIHQTHGATPERRRSVRNALFLVLTKHDMMFQAKKGDTKESRKAVWDSRLWASFEEMYQPSGWPDDWDGEPFRNAVFLRNPELEQPHLMDYAEPYDPDNPIEIGVSAKAKDLIDEFAEAFMSSAKVGKYFARKEEAWRAALEPRDGGVTFLVGRLDTVLDPDLKRKQASERLREAAGNLEQRLRSFYHGEGDTARQEKDAALQLLRRDLHQRLAANGFRSFAALLNAMMLAPADIRGVFSKVAALKEDELVEGEPAEAAPTVEADPWGDDPWAEPEPGTAAAPKPTRTRADRPERFASEVMNLWDRRLRGLQQDARALAALGVDADLVGRLVDDLVIGANREGLAARIADDVRQETMSVGARFSDGIADRAARIAQLHVNDFVAYLGFGPLPEAERPAFPEPPKPAQRTIFSLASLRAPGTDLGEAPEAMDRLFFVDWGVALRSLGVANVGHAAGREISDEQNRRLGEILTEVAIADLGA